ncbi:MAG TPA: family 1 glycosylhydrolase [Polyangiaceae bacterium]|nr:family 1 glycosylhydrolase [Polyangiaceae bacterium]
MSDFPGGFLFGCATSATQIEGGCKTSDWWEFARQAGRVAAGDVPDVACDHWNRLAQDTELLVQLGVGAHRLSVEWARIEPEPGRFDDAALEHYRAELQGLSNIGVEPLLTLHHFSFPSWLARRGGALAPELPARFEAFTRRVARVLGDRVKIWTTINEPNVLVAQGYMLGHWPPGLRQPKSVPRAVSNLRRAHVAAYRAIHELVPHASVGLAHHVRLATPASRSLSDRATARLLDVLFNGLFMDLPQDYLGLNYYSRDIVRFDPTRPNELFAQRSVQRGAALSDLGWEIYPRGLGMVLRRLARRGKPIWITENGVADASDLVRTRFIADHLAEIARALADGVDVRGYMHWSLLDNFEWAEGYAPRFGLYSVDYATQTRTLRASGEAYAQIITARRL